MNDSLFVALQRVTPQHALSRLAGNLARCDTPWIKNQFIQRFVNHYDVDMSLAELENPLAYPSFNAFFTRALKADARPIDAESDSLVCPADGAVSQAGDIEQGRVLQAKGQSFTVTELLGGDTDAAATYAEGHYTTVYLSPRDYHRVHMPCAGKLTKMVYIPGKLFSVNKATSELVPRLFARNERVVCHFQGEQCPFVVVMVGAMIVASIETAWAGTVTPLRRKIKTLRYDQDPTVHLQKGEEMGRFLLGSTVIALFPQDKVKWQDGFAAGKQVQMGQAIGTWVSP